MKFKLDLIEAVHHLLMTSFLVFQLLLLLEPVLGTVIYVDAGSALKQTHTRALHSSASMQIMSHLKYLIRIAMRIYRN